MTPKSLFGIASAAGTLTPNEFFALHNCRLMDFMAGIFYLCWVPVPILFGIWLYFKRQYPAYLHFSLVFLLVNLIGFAVYYIHPAAPPWYVASHGFDFIVGTPGEVAGLGKWDEMTGLGIFHGLYSRNANVFAAMPSLHAAYMLIALLYSLKARCPGWMRALFAFICLGIWFTAVYTSHHYILDVLAGIGCTLAGYALFEYGLMKIPAFARFMSAYTPPMWHHPPPQRADETESEGRLPPLAEVNGYRRGYRPGFLPPHRLHVGAAGRTLRVSPNAITIAAIFLGIGAGVLFYFPDLWINVAECCCSYGPTPLTAPTDSLPA